LNYSSKLIKIILNQNIIKIIIKWEELNIRNISLAKRILKIIVKNSIYKKYRVNWDSNYR
jgi:hypothetical protein